jgi:hypothetical protein
LQLSLARLLFSVFFCSFICLSFILSTYPSAALFDFSLFLFCLSSSLSLSGSFNQAIWFAYPFIVFTQKPYNICKFLERTPNRDLLHGTLFNNTLLITCKEAGMFVQIYLL